MRKDPGSATADYLSPELQFRSQVDSHHHLSPGTTVTPSTYPPKPPPTMTRSVSGRDQSGDDPNTILPSSVTSRFTQSQYAFPIDAELTSYPMPQSYARQLEEAATTVDQPGSGSLSSLPMNPNGGTSSVTPDPGMAPPQTPTQPFVPTAPRAGSDNASDLGQGPQTGDKRKRSKTSRACDECRRKKVTSHPPLTTGLPY